jgi:3-deoxy-manno-octulosonate cytidylyltransferase (CMP-KDO synthetase)
VPRAVAVIPARMGSSRFPGKPLVPLLGLPMLAHVYYRTAACRDVAEVVVATCDREISDACRAFGARVIMTSPEHERASDRVAEASEGLDAEIVVMVQGDEPLIVPEMIAAAIEPLAADAAVGCVNLSAPVQTVGELLDPGTIKVVTGCGGDALYFSRAPIPALAGTAFTSGRWHKQVCVIPFRTHALRRFATLSPGPLEIIESVDMLRFLEHGFPVRIVPVDRRTQAVDTPRDAEAVAALLEADPFTRTYPGGSA